jgi:hypothetical protein
VKSQLAALGVDSGPASPEIRKAVLLREELDRKVVKQMASILKVKATQLEATRDALEKTKQELRFATTNTPASSVLFTNYLAAKVTVEASQEARNNIIFELDSFWTNFAYGTFKEPFENLSLNYRAQLIREADAPLKPSSPDPRVAKIGTAAGILSLFISTFCLLIHRRNAIPSRPGSDDTSDKTDIPRIKPVK